MKQHHKTAVVTKEPQTAVFISKQSGYDYETTKQSTWSNSHITINSSTSILKPYKKIVANTQRQQLKISITTRQPHHRIPNRTATSQFITEAYYKTAAVIKRQHNKTVVLKTF